MTSRMDAKSEGMLKQKGYKSRKDDKRKGYKSKMDEKQKGRIYGRVDPSRAEKRRNKKSNLISLFLFFYFFSN